MLKSSVISKSKLLLLQLTNARLQKDTEATAA